MSEVQLSRRGLVAVGGASAALVGASGLTVPAAAAAAVPIGVLVPAATSDPRSGRRLLDGLAVGFASARMPASVASRPVSYGYLGAVDATEELIAGGAKVVVAAVSSIAARRVAATCAEAGVGLVVANVGAHLVDEPLPGAVQNSLQHWQSSLRAGEWAAARLGRTLFAIVAVPDAGYDTVFAVRRGFQAAGGRPVGVALTHEDPRDDGVEAAVRQARRSGAKVVAVSASGRRAATIVRACRRAGLRAELLVDSLALEPAAVGALGRAARGVHSVSSWTPGSSAGRSFERAYRARAGHAPDAFAALGHDTALLVAEGARRVRSSGAGWGRLAASLAGRRVAGARGTQVVDRRLRTVSTPLAVRRTDVRGGRVTQTVLAGRAAVRGVPASMGVLDPDRVAAYVNEYLGT